VHADNTRWRQASASGSVAGCGVSSPQLVATRAQLLQGRGLATVRAGDATGVEAATKNKTAAAEPQDGPLKEYEIRVQEGRLRDDSYQRGGLVWGFD
jgi:protein AFG1